MPARRARRAHVDLLSSKMRACGTRKGPCPEIVTMPPVLAAHARVRCLCACLATLLALAATADEQTQKPPLHGQQWMAITGKPLAATAGALIFERGGNAVDAACAMIAATATMWDVLSWGGETQALIFDPRSRKVVAINGLGVAPSGATVAHFRRQGRDFPPALGPEAAVTPGTPGGLMKMLAGFGRLSLGEVLAPAIRLADGYPIEAQTADSIERNKQEIRKWRYARAVMLPHAGAAREAPVAGEIFRQSDLAATLRKLVEAESEARAAGRSREEAIEAAYRRFYEGDIAREFVRGLNEEGGLFKLEDLAKWQPYVEEPVRTTYHGIEVYKLNTWVQGPVMLEALNILENFDLGAFGYNTSRYIHTLYQAMNLAYADRDFYYGDPYFPPAEPVRGLLSKEYAKARAATINPDHNDPDTGPGDPYPYQGGANPYLELLPGFPARGRDNAAAAVAQTLEERSFYLGTTSVIAADADGWLVAVTPSGGWIPAVIAGHTGIGVSQRLQSFVLAPEDNPYNVLEPGKRPRATLTPGIALRDGAPWLAFAVQGGDGQDQNLLQFFLNVVEFGMTPQQAVEAANFNSFQMRDSFDGHERRPGALLLNDAIPDWTRSDLRKRGYELEFASRTSGPINAIEIDRAHGTLEGGSSNFGEDYGIAW
jgi:gamma-glutamyltranspeptidase / glutathione hydrolase